MLLNLHHIRTAHERIDKVYPPGGFSDAGDYRVVEPVKLGFDIYKAKDQYHVVGRIETTLELNCSRCVEPFRLPVDSQFDLRYQPQSQNTGEAEREVKDEELSSAFYENEQIDLEQLMREQFELALPMKPLCTAACLGICPSCGTNLNRETCDCKQEWEDPRFAALKALTAKDAPDTKETKSTKH
jgi:uncharacterized protein